MKILSDYLQPGSVYFRGRVFEPVEVMAGINELARYLSDHLISPSPFVYLFASNHIKTTLAFFGIIKAHRICVVVDPEIGRLELQEMMQDTPPAACVHIDKSAISWDFGKEIEIRTSVDIEYNEEELHDVCMMMYTAADDGYAKAAMLTHDNLIENAIASNNLITINSKSVICAPLSYSHLYGLQVCAIMPHITGAGCIMIEQLDILNPINIIEKVNMYQVTHLMAVPLIYYLLCKNTKEDTKISNIKYIISGGYKLSDLISFKFNKKFKQLICEGYGLTEAGPSCTFNSLHNGFKPLSIGKALDCCQVKIVDQLGNELLAGKEGEIIISGTNVMKGYYKRQIETNRILKKRWLYSGDIGRKDNDGYIYFLRTEKNMINYGGKKIYPLETERLIKKNKLVERIKVSKAENNLFGQTAYAEIDITANSEEKRSEIKKWLEKNITHYKIPKKIIINRTINLFG